MAAIVLRGDARALPLPDASVDLICTSPPYFSMRSYADAGQHYDGQIGSEATPKEWLAALTDCTREWMRVLKPSGSLFVNLGDKYDSGTTATRINPGAVTDGQGQGWHQGTPRISLGRPKSLLGLPWRYALACTDDLGLILRRDIIWSKPNGLPESVTDRCRSSHEYVFHMVKQPRYFSAVDEIREPHQPQSIARTGRRYNAGDLFSVGTPNTLDPAQFCNPLGKLPGSVWDIPSQPLTVPGWLDVDHFAAFPMELPRRIILGWSPSGICTECGEGRRPVADAERGHVDYSLAQLRASERVAATNGTISGGVKRSTLGHAVSRTITGYACACPQPDAPARPALVVDPFGGTGTTSLVAAAYGRTGVTVDRSADYCRLARWRTTDPAERARALRVAKPPPVPDGQDSLFGLEAL